MKMKPKNLKYEILKEKLEIINDKELDYPFNGSSTVLIDKFLIIGYDNLTFEKLLSKKYTKAPQVSFFTTNPQTISSPSTSQKNSYNSNLGASSPILQKNPLEKLKCDPQFITKKNQFYIEEGPLILNEISSNYDKVSLDSNILIDLLFPNNPIGYFCDKDKDMDIVKNNISDTVFYSNPDTDDKNSSVRKSYNCFAHYFYEKFTSKKNNNTLYLPKVMVFISEYPFFHSFYLLSRKIKEIFTYYITVPIEIILYNLIKFTPSPINAKLVIDMEYIYLNKNIIPKDSFKKYIQNQNIELKNSTIEFPMLPGYPLLQYNLPNVLLNIPNNIIFKVFIATILEKDIFIFSSNLELLNLTIFSFSNLNYPFNDTNYFWINPTISLQALNKGTSQFVGLPYPTILGIHSRYTKDCVKSKEFNDYFILDLDNKEMEYIVKKENDDTNETLIIQNYLKRVIKEKEIGKSLLFLTFKKFYNNYENYMETVKNNKTNDKSLSLFYENVDLDVNRNIQEIFYECLLGVFSLIYKNISLHSVMDTGSNIMDRNRSNETYYNEFNFNNEYFKNNFCKEELLLIKQIKMNFKFSSFVESFIKSHSNKGLHQISFLFIDEFTNLISNQYLKLDGNFKINCLELINKFYKNNRMNLMQKQYKFNNNTNIFKSNTINNNSFNNNNQKVKDSIVFNKECESEMTVKTSHFYLNFLSNNYEIQDYLLTELRLYHAEKIDLNKKNNNNNNSNAKYKYKPKNSEPLSNSSIPLSLSNNLNNQYINQSPLYSNIGDMNLNNSPTNSKRMMNFNTVIGDEMIENDMGFEIVSRGTMAVPPMFLSLAYHNNKFASAKRPKIESSLPREKEGESAKDKYDYYSKLSKVIKMYYKSTPKDIDYYFIYEHIQLDNSLLLKYIYKIQNLPESFFKLYFPLYKQITNATFNYIDIYQIEELIEKEFIDSDYVTFEYLLTCCIFNLFTITRLICGSHDLVDHTLPFVSLIGLDIASIRKYYKELFSVLDYMIESYPTNIKMKNAIGYCYSFIINNLRSKEIVSNKYLTYIINKINRIDFNPVEDLNTCFEGEEEKYDYELYLTYNQTKKGIIKEAEIMERSIHILKNEGFLTADFRIINEEEWKNETPMLLSLSNIPIGIHFQMKNQKINYETNLCTIRSLFNSLELKKNTLIYSKNNYKINKSNSVNLNSSNQDENLNVSISSKDSYSFFETNDNNLFAITINLMFYMQNINKIYENKKDKKKKKVNAEVTNNKGIDEDTVKTLVNLLIKIIIALNKSLRTI